MVHRQQMRESSQSSTLAISLSDQEDGNIPLGGKTDAAWRGKVFGV